jgi:hypothetical protein
VGQQAARYHRAAAQEPDQAEEEGVMAKPKDSPNESTVVAVSKILAKLPVMDGQRAEIARRAAEIVETAEVVGECLPHMSRSVSTASAQKSLDQVANLAQKLAAQLDGLSKQANEAIDASLSDMGAPKYAGIAAALASRVPTPPQHPITISLEMRKLLEVITKAQAKLAKNPKAGPRGRPVARPASDVTRLAHGAYESLTGKTVTRGHYDPYSEQRHQGEFEQLLDELFAALGIKASSERRTRSIRDKKPKK